MLDYGPHAVSLSVIDNGIGFDPAAHHDGFGLVGVRERAERIGASLHVTSAPGRGSTVYTRLATGGR